jgi:hypothetical protein
MGLDLEPDAEPRLRLPDRRPSRGGNSGGSSATGLAPRRAGFGPPQHRSCGRAPWRAKARPAMPASFEFVGTGGCPRRSTTASADRPTSTARPPTPDETACATARRPAHPRRRPRSRAPQYCGARTASRRRPLRRRPPLSPLRPQRAGRGPTTPAAPTFTVSSTTSPLGPPGRRPGASPAPPRTTSCAPSTVGPDRLRRSPRAGKRPETDDRGTPMDTTTTRAWPVLADLGGHDGAARLAKQVMLLALASPRSRSRPRRSCRCGPRPCPSPWAPSRCSPSARPTARASASPPSAPTWPWAGWGATVFAGDGAGWAYMTGATGGYLLGYLLATVLLGALARRGWDRSVGSMGAGHAPGQRRDLRAGRALDQPGHRRRRLRPGEIRPPSGTRPSSGASPPT